jgi:hypothetical protein
MSGPAAVTQSKDWPAFQEEWRATFADHAKDAGVAFEVQKGEARSIGEAGTLLQVYLNDYRIVGIGAAHLQHDFVRLGRGFRQNDAAAGRCNCIKSIWRIGDCDFQIEIVG